MSSFGLAENVSTDPAPALSTNPNEFCCTVRILISEEMVTFANAFPEYTFLETINGFVLTGIFVTPEAKPAFILTDNLGAIPFLALLSANMINLAFSFSTI